MDLASIQRHAEKIDGQGAVVTENSTLREVLKLLHDVISLTQLCYGNGNIQMSGLLQHQRNLAENGSEYNKNLAVECAKGVLDSLRSDLDAGLVGDLQRTIEGEVLGDLVELAKTVLSDSSAINVAAVLTAAVYEDTIRRMGRQLAEITDRPKLETVINKLKEAGHFKGAQVGIAQSYLKFRNDALHADWDDIEKESVNSCLSFVEGLLSKHFS